MTRSKSKPGPHGVVFLARLEADSGRFDSLCAPKGLKSEPFWAPKSVESGPEMCFSTCTRELIEVLKRTFLAHFVAVLWLFGHLGRPRDVWTGQQGPEMRQSNQGRGKRTGG